MKKLATGIAGLFVIAFMLGMFMVTTTPGNAEASILCEGTEFWDDVTGCYEIDQICTDDVAQVSWHRWEVWCYIDPTSL